MKMIKAASAAIAAAALLAPASPASAGPYWNKTVKCKETDPDGLVIPTRRGNGDLGWNHFSGKHNIRKCAVVNAALRGNVDKKNGPRREYWGYAIANGGRQVKIVVVVQYARRSADGEYDAGRGQKIGVVTAYCKGVRKCPDWVNV
ncbi:hypothetical protein [Streptomyces sp. NPDC057302]|uniref:hypothetical protein n=1 Tax=Streptomyces sp. NPDC057302 TaxID=3346094 RepID=UPI003637E0A9